MLVSAFLLAVVKLAVMLTVVNTMMTGLRLKERTIVAVVKKVPQTVLAQCLNL